jgi:REP element-mobilizing transposase RayT
MAKTSVILAHHLLWTGYGCWLPNDPRGSTSTHIASDVIAELGELHLGRKRIQPAGWVIRDFYRRAKDVLTYPTLSFRDEETSIVAECFEQVIRKNRLTCYACAILPDHVHILIRRHRHDASALISLFQDASRLELQRLRYPQHPVWAKGGWKVFLDTPADIHRTIKYIRNNPVKMRRPVQEWKFVTPYDGWPFGRQFGVGQMPGFC